MFRISLLVIFVAILGLTSASSDQCLGECPAGYPDNDVYLLPHEDCNKYCSCVYGNPVEMICPLGLHYSEDERTCADPAAAKCIRGFNSISEQRPKALKSKWYNDDTERDCLSQCPRWLGSYYELSVIVAHKECHKFCKCTDDGAKVHTCPKNLHFNFEYGSCTSRAEANCQGIIVDDSPPDTDHCECPGTTTTTTTTSYPTPTPTTTHPTTTQPTTTQPTTTTTVESTTTTKRPSTPSTDASGCRGSCVDADEGDDVVQLPHEDCTKFCKCDFGIAYVFTCPHNLHYNPDERVCDRPSAAGCTGSKSTTSNAKPTRTTTPTPSNPGSTPSRPPSTTPSHDISGCIGSCEDWGDDDVLQLPHKECTKFCKCDFGIAYVFTCPHNLHYNPDKRVCDRPSVAHCTGIGGKPNMHNENDIAQQNVMGYNTLFRW